MRVWKTNDAFISADAAGERPLAGSLDPTTEQEKIDGFTAYAAGSFSIDPTATEALDLGDMTTAKGFWIRSTADLDVTINGAAAPLNMRKLTGGGEVYIRIGMDVEVTSVSLTNPAVVGGSVATGDYRFWA